MTQGPSWAPQERAPGVLGRKSRLRTPRPPTTAATLTGLQDCSVREPGGASPETVPLRGGPLPSPGKPLFSRGLGD